MKKPSTTLLNSPKKQKSAQRERFKVIKHKGIDIALFDYSQSSRDDVWALTREFDLWMPKQAPNSARLLFDVDRPYYEASHVNHWKRSLGANDAFIRKSCFINASPLMMLMLPTMRAFAALTGAPMKKDRGLFFKSREEALDWLAAD